MQLVVSILQISISIMFFIGEMFTSDLILIALLVFRVGGIK